MNSQQKKDLRQLLIVLCLVVLVAICGYVAGHREASKYNNDLKLQMKIDSLNTGLNLSKVNEKKLSDSLKTNTDSRLDRIEIIDAVKKTIRNEIAKTKQTFSSMPDSNVQRYVDSVRSAGGF